MYIKLFTPSLQSSDGGLVIHTKPIVDSGCYFTDGKRRIGKGRGVLGSLFMSYLALGTGKCIFA